MAMTHHETIKSIVVTQIDGGIEKKLMTHNLQVTDEKLSNAGLDISLAEVGGTLVYLTGIDESGRIPVRTFTYLAIEPREV